MPSWMKALLGLYTILLNVALVYLLVRMWPVPAAGKTPVEYFGQVSFFWGEYALPMETRYLLLAALSGALGSYVHLASSFIDFAGNRSLKSSWAWWYVLRPFIGLALAMVVYFVVRGGLVSGIGDTATATLSPYGVCAICGLSGMFSKQATDKLREVFENFFRTDRRTDRKDGLSDKDSTEEQR